MKKPKPRKRPTCPHDPEAFERCTDGDFCPACGEGVCADCRRLWQPTGAVNPETSDFEEGPNCSCADPVVLPVRIHQP